MSVHGGPSSAVLPRWPDLGYNSVAFSALDYFVLMPNPRGSYGEGEAFTAANRKDFGYGDLRDILAGVDAVTAQFPIDQQRIGLTGWSYGGFMTMFAVTQTHRFHAAVAGAGIANWQSYYGENSIDQWMTPFFGASVYDDPGVYAKSSAIDFIHNVKTPTLVVVGDRDGECPAPQSFEFWHALRAQHVPTSWWSIPTKATVSPLRNIAATCWRAPCHGLNNTCRRIVRLLPCSVPSTLRTLTTHNSDAHRGAAHRLISCMASRPYRRPGPRLDGGSHALLHKQMRGMRSVSCRRSGNVLPRNRVWASGLTELLAKVAKNRLR